MSASLTESAQYSIVCRGCRTSLDESAYRTVCPACGNLLDFRYQPVGPFPSNGSASESMWRYRDWLPLRRDAEILSLGEGRTPLLRSRDASEFRLFFKNETANPTGSHKDRNLSVGISKAVEFGFDTVLLYSDGSTSLSSAAYAARAGLRHITVVPRDTPEYRLLPLSIYNSVIVQHQGRASDALEWAHLACERLGFCETSTYRRANPYGSEAPKTIAFEVWDQLGEVPDWMVIPVGGGGTLAGLWQGFQELAARGITTSLPRLAAVLPEGHDLLETAAKRGIQTAEQLREIAPLDLPSTVQVKLAMSFPPDGIEAIRAIEESGGVFLYASDEAAFTAQRKLGGNEGLYVELSASPVLTGVELLQQKNLIAPGQTVVALLTGSGFRETAQLVGRVMPKFIHVNSPADIAALEEISS